MHYEVESFDRDFFSTPLRATAGCSEKKSEQNDGETF